MLQILVGGYSIVYLVYDIIRCKLIEQDLWKDSRWYSKYIGIVTKSNIEVCIIEFDNEFIITFSPIVWVWPLIFQKFHFVLTPQKVLHF